MALAAASQTFFGWTLPGNWLDWLALLIAVWSGLSIFHAVAAAFVDQHKKRPVDLRLEGYILPAGWIVWGCLLVYGETGPFSVLLFLVGVLAMLIAARVLRR